VTKCPRALIADAVAFSLELLQEGKTEPATHMLTELLIRLQTDDAVEHRHALLEDYLLPTHYVRQ
jgi:hypothetical protein